MLGRQRTQVCCHFVSNKTIVWLDGPPGISCATRLGEVRIRIISQQDCGGVLRCFHRDGLCPISVSEVRGARCERLSRLGLACHVSGTRGKVHDMHPTTVGPARSLEPPLATRNVGQCHRHLLVSFHQLGDPLRSLPTCNACMYGCIHIRMYSRVHMVRYIATIAEIQYPRQPQKNEKPDRPGRAVASPRWGHAGGSCLRKDHRRRPKSEPGPNPHT